MRNLITTTLIHLTLLLPTNLSAQWEVQLNNHNFTHLDRICFVDSLYGWAIGGATIGGASPYFYTTDGGKQWYLYNYWMDLMGTDICFVNRDTGFIAGPKGKIYKTTNSGQTWDTIHSPAQQNVMRLFFVDENNGWATLDNQTDNYQLLHTTNGGSIWETQQVFSLNTSSIQSIYFINDSIGFGGGGYFDVINDDSYTAIVKTANKGETWDIKYLNKNQFFVIIDIFFVNDQVGWAVGRIPTQIYFILNTVNGGETWEEKTIPELENYLHGKNEAAVIYSIQFANDTIGWIACADKYETSYILLTTDGGITWKQQYTYYYPIYDICATDKNNAWAVGGDYIYHNNNADTIIVVGIDEPLAYETGITISPNPTNGIIYINSLLNMGKQLSLQIMDVTGKVIVAKQPITNNQLQLDITNKAKGIYFISIFINNQIYQTQKIIKL